MIRNFVAYYDAAQKAIESSDLTFARVRDETGDLMYALSQMKFEVRPFIRQGSASSLVGVTNMNFKQSPSQGKDAIMKALDKVYNDIHEKFAQLQD